MRAQHFLMDYNSSLHAAAPRTQVSGCSREHDGWAAALYLSCECVCTECRWRRVLCVRIMTQAPTALSVFWWIRHENRGTWDFLEGIHQSGGGRSGSLVWISALRCPVTFHPLERERVWNTGAFWQFWCSFKTTHKSLFSWQWVHCSYLPVAFVCLFVNREEEMLFHISEISFSQLLNSEINSWSLSLPDLSAAAFTLLMTFLVPCWSVSADDSSTQLTFIPEAPHIFVMRGPDVPALRPMLISTTGAQHMWR